MDGDMLQGNTWTCSRDMDIQHEHGNTAKTLTCSIDMDMQQDMDIEMEIDSDMGINCSLPGKIGL